MDFPKKTFVEIKSHIKSYPTKWSVKYADIFFFFFKRAYCVLIFKICVKPALLYISTIDVIILSLILVYMCIFDAYVYNYGHLTFPVLAFFCLSGYNTEFKNAKIAYVAICSSSNHKCPGLLERSALLKFCLSWFNTGLVHITEKNHVSHLSMLQHRYYNVVISARHFTLMCHTSLRCERVGLPGRT